MYLPFDGTPGGNVGRLLREMAYWTDTTEGTGGKRGPARSGFTITAVHLDVRGKIPGADQTKFDEAAQSAKKGCPVSRVLNANITMDAKLTS